MDQAVREAPEYGTSRALGKADSDDEPTTGWDVRRRSWANDHGQSGFDQALEDGLRCRLEEFSRAAREAGWWGRPQGRVGESLDYLVGPAR